MVERVGHRKLIAIIRVGHVKIFGNFFKGMSIKIHDFLQNVFSECCKCNFRDSNLKFRKVSPTVANTLLVAN